MHLLTEQNLPAISFVPGTVLMLRTQKCIHLHSQGSSASVDSRHILRTFINLWDQHSARRSMWSLGSQTGCKGRSDAQTQSSQSSRPWLLRLFLFVPPHSLLSPSREATAKETKVRLGVGKEKSCYLPSTSGNILDWHQLYSMAYCLPPPHQAPGPISSTTEA